MHNRSKFQQPLLQSSVSHDQETFLIIIVCVLQTVVLLNICGNSDTIFFRMFCLIKFKRTGS